MKILWVADYSLKEHQGGAQQTNDVMIKAGVDRGHIIDTLGYEDTIPELSGYDLIILNNIAHQSRDRVQTFLDTGKCIRYEHDDWVPRNWPELYKSIPFTIFLSPLHRDRAFKEIGYKFENCTIIPSPIDSKLFCISDEPKEKNSVLCVGNLCPEKGLAELIQYAEQNPHLKFYCVGWGNLIKELEAQPNIEFVGELHQEDLVKYYQRCEYFYHRPRLNEAFGRTVIEAYLCGCNLLLNNNIGAISWDWDFSNYEEVKKAVQSQNKFWKVVENEIQTIGNME